MEIAEHLDVLEAEGRRFLEAATSAGFDAPVPACPDWTVLDLVRHLGGVHRWATSVVADLVDSSAEGWARYDAEQAAAPHDDVAEWFTDGHERLLDALRHRSPDDDFWRFSRSAPSSLAFWARRQAHETAMHRVDAEDASREAGSPFPAHVAADGIDELFSVFAARKREPIVPARTLLAMADDVSRQWHITLGSAGVVMVTDPDGISGGADTTVSGPADALYRLLWNRIGPDSPRLRVSGDPATLVSWHGTVSIT